MGLKLADLFHVCIGSPSKLYESITQQPFSWLKSILA